MADRGDHRRTARGHRPHQLLVGERQQVLDAAAAPGDHDHVDLRAARAAPERQPTRAAHPHRCCGPRSWRAAAVNPMTTAPATPQTPRRDRGRADLRVEGQLPPHQQRRRRRPYVGARSEERARSTNQVRRQPQRSHRSAAALGTAPGPAPAAGRAPRCPAPVPRTGTASSARTASRSAPGHRRHDPSITIREPLHTHRDQCPDPAVRAPVRHGLTMGRMTATPARRVLLAAPRGYCAGVDRAVIAVEKALEQ
ncbi:hypothetical protein SCALM49S_03784 [Streptomyces californicus]